MKKDTISQAGVDMTQRGQGNDRRISEWRTGLVMAES